MPNYTSLDIMKASGLPVVIFGAGSSGEALYYAAKNQGIDVSAFADTNTSNISRVKGKLCGLPVFFTGDLPAHFSDANFLISANYIGDFVRDLGRLGFHNWYPGGELLKGFNLAEVQEYTRDFAHIRHSVEAAIDSHDAYLDPSILYMRSVDVFITEQCSMKCADCSNLMQFYQKPRNFDTEEVKAWVDAFCQSVDRVGEARVIGGEPFMHKGAAEIIRHCAEKSEFRRVTVFTNGTIPLNEVQLELLNHPKVVFLITSYQGFKKQHDKITTALSQKGIRWVLQEARGWTDCGHLLPKQNLGSEKLTEFFESCCANKLYTISGGKLYRCPFSANGVGLGAFPDFEQDRVNFMNGPSKEKLRTFMNNLPYLEACDFCPGRRLDDPEITPGVQTRKPLEYLQLVKIG